MPSAGAGSKCLTAPLAALQKKHSLFENPDPRIQVALISTITSPAFGPCKSTSQISMGFPASNATVARVFTVCSSVSDSLGGLGSVPKSVVPRHLYLNDVYAQPVGFGLLGRN